MPTCETGSLSPYLPTTENPWNEQKVLHLFRRLGFGAPPVDIQAALAMTPSELIDSIIDDAIALPTSPAPEWAFWQEDDYTEIDVQAGEQMQELYLTFVNDMLNNGFRDKMTLFWHGHLVTQLDVYACPSYMYQYYHLLQDKCLGNFQEFIYDMGINPAMLIFLNGFQNTAEEPNENFARELYELFTLGQDNGYTQSDIEETARALTGWVNIDWTNFCGPITFNADFHDVTDKTIFGQTGNWGYNDVIDILFQQRSEELSLNICKKLYGFFISSEIDDVIVSELAATFQANNFEITPVLRQLFKSEHFFDENIIGVMVKSPHDVFFSFLNDSGLTYDNEIVEAVAYFANIMGQSLFNPPDVAGWEANHTWINSSTLTARWQMLDYYLYWVLDGFPEDLRNLATLITNNDENPEMITQQIVDYFVPNGLQTAAQYEQATDVFKWEVPQNYFDDGLWNLSWEFVPVQVALLLQHIGKMPEFQLT